MRHTATTHPISWFTERDTENNLTLRPSFQRRRVWADRQKCNLIESILLELPVPEIYVQVQTEPTGRSEYIVVDGQQRINAILEFVGAGGREPFELRYLEADSRWTGQTFDNLTDEQKAKFYGHSMAVRYLQEANPGDIEDLFRRLNKYVTPLNAQELRNATYKGPFLRLAESLAEDTFWSENRLATPQAIRRMGDIEFVSDLMIGVLHGPQSGNARTLDDYYAVYEDHEREFPEQRDCRRRFLRAQELIQEIVVDLRSSRWSNRTDFYTLFVATAHLLRDHMLPDQGMEQAPDVLHDFQGKVDKYQRDGNAKVEKGVADYVDAIRRGSSDRNRRGIRHQVMLEIMTPLYKKRGR